MKLNMTRIALALALLPLSGACRRKLNPDQVKKHLEIAWSDHLQRPDSTKTPRPKFDVLDVEYYEDTLYYLCEFKVRMTLSTGQDTIGIMRAKVSKDFSTIK